MKKNKIIVIALLLVAVGFVYFAMPAAAQPGGATDPLVTQRYVQERIGELQRQIDALQGIIANLSGTQQAPGGVMATDREAIIQEVLELVEDMLHAPPVNVSDVVPFTIIHVSAGSTVIFYEGAEAILRSGNAVIVAGENGLVNVTAGADIGNGQRVPANNLLLVPRSDGRGMRFSTDGYIMVKGQYRIQ